MGKEKRGWILENRKGEEVGGKKEDNRISPKKDANRIDAS